MTRRPTLYAGRELGAYGYHEKPWYLPGARLSGFLKALDAKGLTDRVDFREAGPAGDDDLRRFHDAGYIDDLRERCARDEGSLDRAAAPVIEDARRLLSAIRSHGGHISVDGAREAVEGTLVPSMTLDAYLPYLAAEGLLVRDADTLALTPKGEAFVDEERPWLSGPTLARRHVEVAATWVAGAAMDATRRIVRGELSRVFIPIAGYHHALRDEARLYCLYNDPALAIAVALEALDGVVGYVDIDIHQGDGVYEGFADDPRVAIVDLHEDPSTLFPFTPEHPGTGAFAGRRDQNGRGAARGTKLNLPLEPNTTDEAYLARWQEAEAFLRAARPAMIVFEAGVDGLEGDPMSHQRISVGAIAEVTRRVVAIADELAGGRLLVLGGGGYDLAGTAAAWATVVEVLTAGP